MQASYEYIDQPGRGRAPIKIATFNINNVRKRLTNLLAWLKASEPDVVCLQELKSADGQFPRAEIEAAGYGAAWRGERSWNGVAILARGKEPLVTRRELPGDPADLQSRYLEAAVNGLLVGCLYAPNGNPQPGPKFDYKLAWLDRLLAHASELRRSGAPIVLAGDFNVVPEPFDMYPSKSWDKNALVQPQSRERFASLLAGGWIDTLRLLHPHEPMFTFWDYMRQRWERDAGLRLDHLLVTNELATSVRSAGVDRWARGEPGASDHAPAWLELDFPSRRRRASRPGRSR